MEKDLTEFIKKRGIAEEITHKLNEDKVDKYVIRLMDEETLKQYFPIVGDRISIKEFCRKVSKESERKNSILNRLRQKLQMKQDTEVTDNEEGGSSENLHFMTGNKNAKKSTRKIEVGWLHYDEASKSYRQVRKKGGGSTRKVDMQKEATRTDIEKVAKELFFPSGYSKVGRLEDFICEVRDYAEEPFTTNETIGDMYSKTKINMLRFYLATKAKAVTEENLPGLAVPKRRRNENPEKKPEDLLQTALLEAEVDLLGSDTDTCNSEELVNYINESSPNFQNLLNDSETEVFFKPQPDNDKAFLGPAEITIHRGKALTELIGYFKEKSIVDRVLNVTRILPNGQKEIAEDTGGVFRDLLSEFWTDFYERCTMGKNAKVPALRHDFGEEEWTAVCRVLIYGKKHYNYFPIRLAQSFLIKCIFPGAAEDRDLLLKDFLNFIPLHDKSTIQTAMMNYNEVDKEELAEVLDTYHCRTVTTEDNIKSVIIEIAHKELIQEPNYVSECWKELQFCKLSIEGIRELYENLMPTNRRVVQIIQFPDVMTSQTSEISKYLKRYIRELDPYSLERFLRYCTGSDLLISEKITVEFTKMQGFERRPVAHTCGCLLQLADQTSWSLEMNSIEFGRVIFGSWTLYNQSSLVTFRRCE